MKVSELRRRIERIGCYVTRNGANHDIYYSPITDKKFPVSRHMSEEVPIGTQRSIEKSAGLK
ncbi:type II toxin-antitoxin system HicA family toxin [Dysgonomonas macrotermitis]|uniref:Predicted RNA binding protein YcfA, dsRBD-like fold, HicA-like mRNA interferase family n=1 Tax=Dysgonomonas macrotermitis TaxID=1346286 RepID=A0A1M4UKK5_9BACT|nr:type II toxin-antitoxin system HicA family toxin [Dysgonomonas macrotermitis]SHE57217.1 Predicted RNA binding protein YcfA, dsRBD-like fold, HicA-like mRNA interferase family [Dysgonomonas macrotermitis]